MPYLAHLQDIGRYKFCVYKWRVNISHSVVIETEYRSSHLRCLQSSVPDPYIFGSLGSASGSVIYLYGSGSGSFHQQAKKTLIPTVFVTS